MPHAEAKEKEYRLLNQALNALEQAAGITAKVLPLPPKENPRYDALLELRLNGSTERFVVEIKRVDRLIAIAQIKEQLQAAIKAEHKGYFPLLITAFATADLAEQCRRLGLAFVDTAGNLYVHTTHYLADIRGKTRPDRALKDEYRATTATGLKVIFALLCQPELANQPYRDIARLARVSLGAVGPVLKDLTQRGYIRKGKLAKELAEKKRLLNEWVAYYPAKLRPTLYPQRYQADRTLLTQTDPTQFGAYWGGEYAAEQLTRYLKAEHFTIYVQGAPPRALMTRNRMHLAPDGNTEILQAFWHPQLVENPRETVPPLLVFADLMATTDPRNVEAAQEIYEKFLEPTLN